MVLNIEQFAQIDDAHRLAPRCHPIESWRRQYEQWSSQSQVPGDGSPFHFDRQIFGTTLLRGVDFNRKQRITDEQPLTVFENEFLDPDGGQLLDEEAGWCDESTLNYRFFVTSTGSPALGPIALQEGDTVALLRGGNVP